MPRLEQGNISNACPLQHSCLTGGRLTPNQPPNSLVTHQQHFQLLDIVDQKLAEAAGQHVLGLLVAPVADVGHQDLALEPSPHPVVDASGFLPVSLNFHISV